MRDFPNYLMPQAERYHERQKETMEGIALTTPLKKEKNRGPLVVKKEKKTVEMVEKVSFQPTILPRMVAKRSQKDSDYEAIKKHLQMTDDTLLLFDDREIEIADERKKVYQSHALKSQKRGLHRSMDGIFEQEVTPEQYFSDTVWKEGE